MAEDAGSTPESGSGRKKIAIVGAGPGGLAAAVLLVSRGLDVTIYEAQNRIGGRSARITLGDHHFDTGPTFFLMPHVLDEIFSAVGAKLADEVDLRRLDPLYRLVIGQPDGEDIVIDPTQDTDKMAERIAAVHQPDGRAFRAFVEHNRAKLNAAEPILRRPIRSPLDLIKADAIKALPYINPHKTVHSLSSKYFDHPAVKLAVGFQSKYLGMSPMECPSLFTILPFIEYEYGVWHPIGGCNAIMEALARVFVRAGGKIETSSPVESLEIDNGRVRGLNLGGDRSGERIECDHAVINADAAWAIKKLIPQQIRGRDSNRAFDNKKYSCSTYMLYLGVEGGVDLPHHTIRTARAYEQNLDDISRGNGSLGSLTADPSFYVCNPSITDPSLAPEGDSSVYVLLPTPNGKANIDWSAESDRLRELLLDRIDSVLGEDLRGRIKHEKRLTPDDWRGMNINHGATFNLSHSLDQMLHKRPQHKLPYCDGAWLVGGGTHPGSGLPVIFLSAQITAKMLCEQIGVGAPEISIGDPDEFNRMATSVSIPPAREATGVGV